MLNVTGLRDPIDATQEYNKGVENLAATTLNKVLRDIGMTTIIDPDKWTAAHKSIAAAFGNVAANYRNLLSEIGQLKK